MTKEILSVLETLETDKLDYYFEMASWRKFAACLGLHPSEFYPTRGADQDELHKYCEGCMVQTECLSYAILSNEVFGFWGNYSERARKRLRKQLGKSRPDLLKAGTKLASRNKKGVKSKLAKAFAGVNDDVEPIDEGELMEHLLPKVRQLLQRLAQQQGVANGEQFLLSINISPEAFAQRLNLARQMKWVSLDGQDLKLTRTGRQQLAERDIPVAIRTQVKQATTPQEVSMASNEYDWLNDLDIEILACLAAGEIEDGANASGVLAEKIGAETGSSFSTRLKRLDDEGLIRRRVNGKRTNYLAITSAGNKVLNRLGTPVPPSSNGSKPSGSTSSVPTSDEVEGWSSEVEEQLAEQLDGLKDLVDGVRVVLAENTRLRQIREDLQARAEAAEQAEADAKIELDELKTELEHLRPLAERYTQMQQLLSAPAE